MRIKLLRNCSHKKNDKENLTKKKCHANPRRNENYLFCAFCAALISLLLANCQLPTSSQKKDCIVRAKQYHEEFFTCFENGLKNLKGKDLFCETSGVVYTKERLTLASDKPMPDGIRSSIFSLPTQNGRPLNTAPTFLTNSAFLNARKIEDLTLTVDKKYLLATTTFDRESSEKNPDGDRFNTLLIWPVDTPDLVKVVSPISRDGVVSSLPIREKIRHALRTPELSDPYFTVEGLATIPGNKLLFGIRAMGKAYNDSIMVVKIVGVDYKISNGELFLAQDFKLLYEYNPDSTLGLKLPLGLSSLEYDKDTDRLYLLTSFEKKPDIGGYIWVLPLSDFYAQRAPTLALNEKGAPLEFSHKPEGVTALDKHRVFIIHDDDKVKVNGRKPNQAAYSLLEFADCD